MARMLLSSAYQSEDDESSDCPQVPPQHGVEDNSLFMQVKKTVAYWKLLADNVVSRGDCWEILYTVPRPPVPVQSVKMVDTNDSY
jgi:hypothetical protein